MLQGSRKAAPGFVTILACLAILTGPACGQDDSLPVHPALLAPLTPDSSFPRHSAAELAAAGYPNHKYVYAYPWFESFVDEDGLFYGPFSLAQRFTLLPRDGLLLLDGEIKYRHVHLRYEPSQNVFGILPMVEMLDWARRELALLLDHDLSDTLLIENPIDLADYVKRSGFDFHRLYRDTGESIIIEPVQTLMARGLLTHAAFHLTATRLIRSLAAGQALPAWLVEGLASYLSEDGCHFLGYLYNHRHEKPVIFTPSQTELVLSSPPNEDKMTDIYQYRVAGYSAFLMAWELVEHRGGLAPLRELLARAGRGEPIDEACQDLYGSDLAGLTADLDPTKRPEPVGKAVHPREPHKPPSR